MVNRRFQSLVALAVTLIAAASAIGCGNNGGGTATTGSSKDSFRIYGVIHGSPGADPYWGQFLLGAKDAAEKLGVELKTFGTPKFSIQAHADLVDSAIAAKPDGLITSVPDGSAIDAPLRNAIKDGLPVMAWDTADARPPKERIPYLRYIGVDYLAIGKLAADRLLQEGTPKHVACAIHEVGAINLETTCKGFTDELTPHGVQVDKIEISGTDPTKAAEQARGYFTTNPDADAIFTQGPPASGPVRQVLNEENLLGKVTHITSVFTPDLVEPIRSGEILAVVDQAPYLQGFQGVTQMYLYLKYGLLANTDTTVENLIDKSNIDAIAPLVKQGIR